MVVVMRISLVLEHHVGAAPRTGKGLSHEVALARPSQ